jgi:hypothetical protein
MAPPRRPWFSIWRHPRRTVRELLDRPRGANLWLGGLDGASAILAMEAFSRFAEPSRPRAMPALFQAVPLGFLAGVIHLFAWGLLLKWTGRWLGGKGTWKEVRTAIAWGSVPSIWCLPIWVLLLAVALPARAAHPDVEKLIGLTEVLCVPIGIWQLLVTLQCVGEAHRFSAWRALGASLLTTMLVILPLLVAGSISLLA